MRLLEEAEGGRPTPLRERILGWLMLAGGAVAFLTVLLPPAAARSDAAVMLCGAVALVVGLLLLSAADQGVSPPEFLLGLAAALGTALIAAATWAGGDGPTGTADNQILFLWIILFAFYFFSLRHAILQLVLIGLAYAVVLADFADPEEIPTRLIVTLFTLLVAGLVIAMLRRRTECALSEAERLARVDELTGALNRRGFSERGATELSRSRRAAEPVGLLLVDLDRFGEYNDAHGTAAGDALLAHVASCLRSVLRAEDAVGRLGPDEFGVLAPGAGEDELRRLGERLRGSLRESWVGEEAITLSIGGAVAGPDGQTFSELARRAARTLAGVRAGGGADVRLEHDPLPPAGAGSRHPNPGPE